MGNCLVTKLKGVVDNDNLEKLREKIFVVEPNSGGAYQRNIAYWGTDVSFTLSDDFSITQKHYEDKIDITVPENEGGTITIDNYYGLTHIRSPHVIIDVNMLKYTPNLNYLSLGYASPKNLFVLSEFKNALKNVTNFEVHDITADFSDFSTLTNLVELITGTGKDDHSITYTPILSNFDGILSHPNIDNFVFIKVDGNINDLYPNLNIKRSTVVSLLTNRPGLRIQLDNVSYLRNDITDEAWNAFMALTPGTQRGYINNA